MTMNILGKFGDDRTKNIQVSEQTTVKYQSALMSPKVGENAACVSNSLDPGKTPSYSVSHPDPNCLHMEPWSRSAG